MRVRLTVLAFLVLMGCAQWSTGPYQSLAYEEDKRVHELQDQSRETYVHSHPELDAASKNKILNGFIEEGMTKEQIEAMGHVPNRTKRKQGSYGKKRFDEVWTFRWSPSDWERLYFFSGVVVGEEFYSR